MSKITEEKVKKVLEKVRPAIKMDGGDLELVDLDKDEGIVQVKLKGACVGCPMSQVTLKMGIESALQDAMPAIKKVVAVE